jgi:hypothetical protein
LGARAAQGIAAESPQALHRQSRGLAAESPVFCGCAAKNAPKFSFFAVFLKKIHFFSKFFKQNTFFRCYKEYEKKYFGKGLGLSRGA